MQTQFNVYSNIYTPKVKDYITIYEWFGLIKQSEFSASILAVRKHDRESSFYKSQKATFPAITYNFTFQKNKNKSNATIAEATGLMYIDVDDLSFDISTLDATKVFAYHRSLSGLGYVILVRVENLTLLNYDLTYAAICDELGLSKYYDNGAKKATQFNVLSFDPDIFINYNNPFVFSSIDNVSPSTVIKEKKKKAFTEDGDTTKEYVSELRYDNLNDYKFIGDYTYDWNGFPYVDCWLPIHKITGNRNKTLLAYTTNLVWLNAHLTINGTISIISNVNEYICLTPVDAAHIKRIVTSVFKYKEGGTLQPIYNLKPRKILFAKDAMLSREEKMKKVRELLGTKKAEESKLKLYQIIEGWDFETNGKITIRAIIKVGKMSNKTIVKYWPEFKEYVAELNEFMGCIKTSNRTTEIVNQTDDTLLSASPEMQPEALNDAPDVAYNFNEAGFNLAGISMLMNAVESLPDDELIKLVVGIEDAYHNQPTGEVSVAAGGLTYKFINDVTASTVSFNGFN